MCKVFGEWGLHCFAAVQKFSVAVFTAPPCIVASAADSNFSDIAPQQAAWYDWKMQE